MIKGRDWEGSGGGSILRDYAGICLEALRKTMKNLRIASLWAETGAWDLPNTKWEC
jgi:hypothetical protein